MVYGSKNPTKLNQQKADILNKERSEMCTTVLRIEAGSMDFAMQARGTF